MVSGFAGLVGRTPLVRIESLSRQTGCEILAKCEHLNPGGSVKDRAALWMIEDAERRGLLGPGGTVVEGTAGNTGIGLALVCLARGYRCVIVVPNNQSTEKLDLLRTLRAELILVPAAPFADPKNYYHVARGIAEERGAFWANQFENTANAMAHRDATAPELWAQAEGRLDGFVCSAGTGGTVGGITSWLKEHHPHIRTAIVDCEGSSLYNHVMHGHLGADGGSILEGIGIRRITANFAMARLDTAFVGTDREAVAMAHHLLAEDGLFVGGSAALNCVGAVKLAQALGPGHRVATVICDGGARYQSRLFDAAWLAGKGLAPA